ncbi:hypothetical protein BJY04DRAFT_60054 [Aspergillus karnatakaensis]|uniref:CFEM domain-containing protein n=1 Tax=Aspergillus karnatakaensis TaxID=1810916 RepID=UPI003CCDC5FC
MKLQTLALALAACLSSVSAQGMPGLPACAQDCATGATPKECSLINVECICNTRSFIDDMACCVSKSCEPEDQAGALEFANGICGGAGITDLPQSATCASDSTSTTTVTDTTTTTAEDDNTTDEPTETATTTTKDDETTTDTETETETSTETTSASETESQASSQTEAPTASGGDQPEETDGAVLLRGKEVCVLAGIVAGVAFLM